MTSFTLATRDDRVSKRTAKMIQDELVKQGLVFTISNPDLVICVGGDGTLLHAIHQWRSQLEQVSFVGIHTGTLGFYTDYQVDEVAQLIEDIHSKVPEMEEKRLLEAHCKGITTTNPIYALNEIRVESIIRTQTIDVTINQDYFERFQGNGLCISGQDGSTAYNRSANGAILWKGLELLQMIELNGIHHYRARSIKSPLILPGTAEITLRSQDAYLDAFLCYDHLSIALDGFNEVKIKLSDKTVRFAHYHQMDYKKRLESLY